MIKLFASQGATRWQSTNSDPKGKVKPESHRSKTASNSAGQRRWKKTAERPSSSSTPTPTVKRVRSTEEAQPSPKKAMVIHPVTSSASYAVSLGQCGNVTTTKVYFYNLPPPPAKRGKPRTTGRLQWHPKTTCHPSRNGKSFKVIGWYPKEI